MGSGKLKISILQFADDTIFFLKECTRDAIKLKVILRCFDLVARLKVNFYKSRLAGVNVDQREIHRCATILNYATMNLPLFTWVFLWEWMQES